MRRPSPPPAAAIAPPPRRRPSGPAPAPSRAPASRPAPSGPPRPPQPAGRRRPNHARRRSIALALILTMLILVGYGGYVAYDKVMGSDSPAATTNDAYVTATHRAMFIGGGAIGAGINLRNLKDQYAFKDQINGQIELVRAERANLEGLLPMATGPQADTIRATLQSIDALMIAMAQWRDTIFTLRLGNVDNAQSAIESAMAQMAQQLETWNGLEAP